MLYLRSHRGLPLPTISKPGQLLVVYSLTLAIASLRITGPSNASMVSSVSRNFVRDNGRISKGQTKAAIIIPTMLPMSRRPWKAIDKRSPTNDAMILAVTA